MSKNLKFYEVDGNVFVHMNEDNKHGVIRFINDLYPGVKWQSGDSLSTDPKSLYGYNTYGSNDRGHSLLVKVQVDHNNKVFLLGDPFEIYLQTEDVKESNRDAFLVTHRDFLRQDQSLEIGDTVAIDKFDVDLVPHYYTHEIEGVGVISEIDTDGTYKVDVKYDSEWVHKRFLTKVEVEDTTVRVGDDVFVEEFDEDLVNQEFEHYVTGVGTVLDIDVDDTYLVDLPHDLQWVHKRFLTKIPQPKTFDVGELVKIKRFDPELNIGYRHYAQGLATVLSQSIDNTWEVEFENGLVQIVDDHFIEKI